LKTSLLDYDLPDDRIATHPPGERDAARLLVLERSRRVHARFVDWAELVPDGALVVLNDTRVIRARLIGERRETGGRVEILLVQKVADESPEPDTETWLAIGRANRPLRPGSLIDAGALSIEVTAREEELLRVVLRASGGVAAAIERHGHVPLPPYLGRPDEPRDVERYQTVFARTDGSVAAPTAGLHVTRSTLARLEARGVSIGFVTLHVGPGTFRPVSVSDLDEHPMHSERFDVSDELALAVRRTRARGGKVVAVGTTVVRALESARDPGDPSLVVPTTADTKLLIQPGYVFGPVDALLTNFHQPRSTLLALVAAFAGFERVVAAYEDAIAAGYRFLSYGDAMWIPERLS